MGGKPSKQTPADQRLKANKQASAAKVAAPGSVKPTAAPKFGSPAWDAKYGKRGK